MVDPREKGARAEIKVRDHLRSLTKLNWERVPGSGMLDAVHKLKGDLYIPETKNRFCVEVKHYEEDHLTSKILTQKTSVFIEWWIQAVTQAEKVNQMPLLIFKHNRSPLFVATNIFPSLDAEYRYLMIRIDNSEVYVSLLDDWVNNENISFTI